MRPLVIGALCGVTISCATGDSDTPGARADVSASLQRYAAHAREVRAESLAAYYTDGATLFEPGIPPISTRDSIRAFMASFPGVRVDSATVETDTIDVLGSSAYVWGRYFERLAFPGQPVSEQQGRFVMQWQRQADGRWLIERYFRVPVTTALVGAEATPR